MRDAESLIEPMLIFRIVHKSYTKLTEAAQIAPNNPNHTDCKLLIQNNRDAAILICKQGVTGSIPVTSATFIGKNEDQLNRWQSVLPPFYHQQSVGRRFRRRFIALTIVVQSPPNANDLYRAGCYAGGLCVPSYAGRTSLPEDVIAEKLTGEYLNGVLEINALITVVASPRKIEIKTTAPTVKQVAA
jgi:hypothetical protein